MRKRRRCAAVVVPYLPFHLAALLCSGCAVVSWIPILSREHVPEPQARAEREPQPSLPQSDVTPPAEITAEPEEAQLSESYEAEGVLLKIVGELQAALDLDTYRFPISKDPTGANVFKATLTRLDDYEAARPGAYPELVAYTRARAYERLREYDQAADAYEKVSRANGRLSREAETAREVTGRFRELKAEPLGSAATPLAYLKMLDEKAAKWGALAKELSGTRFAALALQEEESVDRAKVAFLELNRHQFEDGNALVALAYRKLVNKHRDSKRIHRYLLEFGDFYVTLAGEYVAGADPQGLRFDPSTFEDLGRAALRLYGQVAQEDGIMEKLEARGKLAALEAYMATVGRLSR